MHTTRRNTARALGMKFNDLLVFHANPNTEKIDTVQVLVCGKPAGTKPTCHVADRITAGSTTYCIVPMAVNKVGPSRVRAAFHPATCCDLWRLYMGVRASIFKLVTGCC